jgi:hypothetical protein
MTRDDLDLIEARLGVRLPSEYRQLAVSFTTSLKEDVRDHEIFDDAKRIIAATEKLRLVGPTPEFYWDRYHIVIGDSGCGDSYILDLNEGPAPVKIWNHETSSIHWGAASIDEWYSQVTRMTQ